MSIFSSFNTLGTNYSRSETVRIANVSVYRTIPQTPEFKSINEEWCYEIENLVTSNTSNNTLALAGAKWTSGTQMSGSGVKFDTPKLIAMVYDDSSTGANSGYRNFGQWTYEANKNLSWYKQNGKREIVINYNGQSEDNLSFPQPLRRYSQYCTTVSVGVRADAKTSYDLRTFHYNNPQYPDQSFTYLPMQSPTGKGAVYILETRELVEV